jgi:hypothetical protein
MMAKKKKKPHPLLAKLGRQGGKKRAKNQTKEQRIELAKLASRARWAKQKAGETESNG